MLLTAGIVGRMHIPRSEEGRWRASDCPGPPQGPNSSHILSMTSFNSWSGVKSLSCIWLFVTPWTVAYQAPPSMGFSRQEYWSGLPFPSPTHKSEKWNWSRSVISDSSRPHGLQPTRLLRPWDFPGKSTGVGCHCLLREKAKEESKYRCILSRLPLRQQSPNPRSIYPPPRSEGYGIWCLSHPHLWPVIGWDTLREKGGELTPDTSLVLAYPVNSQNKPN